MQPESPEASMWSSMASAIVGSGSYAIRGQERQQIEILAQWLREGHRQGYDWRGTYQALYHSWASHRPLLPSPEEMERRVIDTA